jgi:hypothetical protein
MHDFKLMSAEYENLAPPRYVPHLMGDETTNGIKILLLFTLSQLYFKSIKNFT